MLLFVSLVSVLKVRVPKVRVRQVSCCSKESINSDIAIIFNSEMFILILVKIFPQLES